MLRNAEYTYLLSLIEDQIIVGQKKSLDEFQCASPVNKKP